MQPGVSLGAALFLRPPEGRTLVALSANAECGSRHALSYLASSRKAQRTALKPSIDAIRLPNCEWRNWPTRWAAPSRLNARVGTAITSLSAANGWHCRMAARQSRTVAASPPRLDSLARECLDELTVTNLTLCRRSTSTQTEELICSSSQRQLIFFDGFGDVVETHRLQSGGIAKKL